MSTVEQQHEDTQPPKQPPGLQTIDFSKNQPLRQMTTTLRRVWLLDPSLSDEELQDPATVQERFRALCEAVSGEITTEDNDNDSGGGSDEAARWDHARWLGRTKLPLLGAPIVRVHVDPPPPHSAESPFREGVYDSYRHVFADLWRVLRAEEGGAQLGRFDAADRAAVSLGVLRTSSARGEELLAYPTDTFLCPVWVRPGARVTFSVGGRGGGQHAWSAEGQAAWTTGLWARAEAELSLTTEVEEPGGDGLTIAAVFVAGHCRKREEEEEEEEEEEGEQEEQEGEGRQGEDAEATAAVEKGPAA